MPPAKFRDCSVARQNGSGFANKVTKTAIISIARREFPSIPKAFATRFLAFGAGCLLILAGASSADANVYATDIRIFGSTPGTATSATVFVPCDNAVLIRYRLNEAADAGVIVEIHSEGTVVRAFTNAPGSPGTLRGANMLIWDVRNEQGEVVPFGFYTVQITAAVNGHGYA